MGRYTERLDEVLARRNLCTHRRIRRFLQKNSLCINQERVLTPGHKISIFSDTITLNGSPLTLAPDIFIMMNKPAGTICTTKDKSFTTVYSLLPQEILNANLPGRIHTVGRLDMDTEGLLIFTTNGDFSHRLSTPEFHVKKQYYIKLESPVNEAKRQEYTEKIKLGIFCPQEGKEHGFTSLPAELEFCSDTECYLTISEGKFHQVKRMIQALGNKVIFLKRIKTGSLELDEKLKPGQWRFLTEDEVSRLTEN